MKRFSERLLLGSLLGGALVLASASCSSSSDSNPPAGTGNSVGNGTAGAAGAGNHGGNGNVGTAGSGTVSTAGNGSVGTAGTSPGSGGTSGIAGATGTAGSGTGTAGSGSTAMCIVDPDLIKSAGASCFVGCDPTVTTDNPQGIQGAFYAYGDGTPTAPKSCAPYTNPPCTGSTMGLCISGTTKADMDYATGWGCGIGLGLNASGGTTNTQSPYTGPAGCFNYTLTGSSGGNEVRINFTQVFPAAGAAPYISLPKFDNGTSGVACIKDATCHGITGCVPVSTTAPQAYDIQFQVVGANNAGTYNMCLSAISPATSGTSTLTKVCGAQGASDGTEDVGKYFVQNDINPNRGTLCVTPAASGSNVSFKVDSAAITGSGLAAYPSIVDGWHYSRKSTDAALPKLVSSLQSVNSSVTFSKPNGGNWDASYDIWVLPSDANAKDPTGGLEVMIWLDENGPQPAGSNTNNPYMGYEVWSGQVQGWKYVAYKKSGLSTFNGDLAPFIKNAVQISGLGGTPYLAGIEFGYEAYDNAVQGQGVSSFSADVK